MISNNAIFCVSHTEGSAAGPGAGVRAAGGQSQRELQRAGQPPRPQPHLVSTPCVITLTQTFV